MTNNQIKARPESVAIIGMSARLPGAPTLKEFWRNLVEGVNSISTFGPDGLDYSLAATDPQNAANYVRARSVLADEDLFDAAFFGIYPKQAELMDPQHRIFLECAWESLESAGYDPETYPGLIGLYAGISLNTYLLHNLASKPGFAPAFAAAYPGGSYDTLFGNDKDFFTTRVAHKLDLRGPCVTVQTACSTSLVAVVHAYYSLLTYQCDMALAGGVSITFPQRRDYLYQPDGMVSRDGACRSFDAAASGTVFGSGVGIVVLKRLSDAIADGDRIHAVLLGAAMNNDGARRVGYAAPGVEGQAAVISMAVEAAGVTADSISYVEAHGTGTPLGDPIEVAALTQAYRKTTAKKSFCGIGTAKTNVGHLDMAAGITGLIKTVLQLEHGTIPPLLHFQKPNPRIDFATTPFFPVSKITDWPRTETPRRAGVSAFGVGGTNAHVVVEEAPLLEPTSLSRRFQLILLSAMTESALNKMSCNLADYLVRNPEVNIADVAFTLQCGRKRFPHRRAIVVSDAQDAVDKLRAPGSKVVGKEENSVSAPEAVFLFPGQGAHYVNMGRELYDFEPVFRSEVDRCAYILSQHLHIDIRDVLYPDPAEHAAACKRINETWITQPTIFAIEYALAKLWLSWGVKPAALIGHSIGEYVCAVLAETFTLEEALGLLSVRARLMQALPSGLMLAVRLGAQETESILPANLSIAAINSPNLCTVSGSCEVIQQFKSDLEVRRVASKIIPTSHAFHSPMMEPMLPEFTSAAQKTSRRAPTIPWISTCTGRAITPEDVTDPTYWAKQVRHTVRFSDSISLVLGNARQVLLEVGPGQALSQAVRQHPARTSALAVLATLGPTDEPNRDYFSMLTSLGAMWHAGINPNWNGFYENEKRRRMPLPVYPFERKRYWVEPSQETFRPATANSAAPALVSTIVSIPQKEDLLSSEIPHPKIEGYPMTTIHPPANVTSRKAHLEIEVRNVIRDLSGAAEDALTFSATFMELGFDSLFLTQASQALQKKFNTKITFRQLLDGLASIGALASYLDQKLPPEAFRPEPPKALPTPVSSTSSPGASHRGATPDLLTSSASADSRSLVERVLAEQMAIMQKQLEILGGSSAIETHPPRHPVVAADARAAITTPKASQAHAKANNHCAEGDLKRFGPFKGIQVGPKGGLTAQQEKALAELTARYNRRTAGSKDYTQRYRSHFCDPRAAGNFRQQWKEMVYPIVCARSLGGKIWDIDGNEYVDLTLGFGANYFGHSPEFVVKAVEEQLHKGFEIGPQSPIAGDIAQMLCEMTGMDRATFCNTGSEAVMAAIRVARTVTARDKIVYFSGDYHGIFDEVLARAGAVNGKSGALPIAPGIPQLPNILVLDYGDPASLDIIRANADEIAGVLVEPVQSRHPANQPREFLQALRKLTQEKDIALIFDEVVTGFRAALGGAQEYFGVRADLATYGKVVGGGMPIGILAGIRRYMDVLDGGMWNFGDDSYPEVGVTFFAGTFVRHPLVMAATHATLKHLREMGPDLQRQTTEKSSRFVQGLNDYFVSVEVPIRLQSFSSVFYYDFHPDLKYASLLFYYLRERGVHVWEGRVGQICTAHTEEELTLVTKAFKASIEEMQAAGFLPASAGTAANTQLTEKSQSVMPGRAPLTEAQHEIWIATQMGEDANCAYNESCSLDLRGPLDTSKFQKALQEFINRHDSLRSRFSPAGDYQEFAPKGAVELPVCDLSGFPPGDVKQEIQAIISGDMASPFDLVNGPVFRAVVLKLAKEHHQFIFTAHHIVCDGWSFGVVFQELTEIYSALVKGTSLNLEAPMQFQEYAEQSREQEQTPEAQEAEKYWLSKYQGTSIPVLDLPSDRPRPHLKTYKGSLAVHRCDPVVFQNLKKTCGEMGHTVFATLLSTFYILLHRLSSQEDIVVGVPAAGQVLAGSNSLVGHCLNFLPMRVNIDGDTPFKDFADRMKSEILDAYDHQNYTYGTLIQKLKLLRDSSRLPLLSVMFNIDKRGFDKLNFTNLKTQVLTNPKKFVNFDLFINLVQGENDLDIECEFNTDLFNEETIMRWLGHFESLMVSITENHKRPLNELAMLDPGQRSKLLITWNQTAANYPKDQTLQSLFEGQVNRTPAAVAAVFGEQTLTYQELNRRANYFAGLLRRAGARRNTFVALCVERNLDMLVGVLAILKAGAAYVPIDSSYPKDLLKFYLEDSQSPLILTQRKLVPTLPAHQAAVVCIDDQVQGGSEILSENDSVPGDLAYVIYTSGSTGKPKGVAIEHRNAVNFINWATKTFSQSEMSGVLASTSICFDLSIFEIFATLSRGGKVILAESVLQLPRLAAKNQVTLVNTVPSAIAELVRERALPQSVQTVNLAGEALPVSLVDEIYALGHVTKVNDLYGPTETTTYSTWTTRGKGEPATIGRPLDNTRIYIVDKKLQPVPIGVPGELLIGGEGVARGYLKRPDLTAAKFITDPFCNEIGARVYRTGDLARYRPDGMIEFLGRIDHQVKFRGFRIELGEIEAQLKSHPAVRDCAVILREDDRGRKQLLGYVSLHTSGDSDAAGAYESELKKPQTPVAVRIPGILKDLAQSKLPAHMVPSAILVLDSFPRRPNGKIDRKALPSSAADPAAKQQEYLAPRNPKEKALAEIWAQVLGIEKVSVVDNFFELGGDSLLCFRVANRASQVGLPLTPRMFFEHKTVSELVRAVEQTPVNPSVKSSAPAITRLSRDAYRRQIPTAV